MLVVTRFDVPVEEADGFLRSARQALSALSAQSGFRNGSIGRAIDPPGGWVLVTRWDGIGAYRRALSAFDVRAALVPLTANAVDEPGAYEVLAVEGARRRTPAAEAAGRSGPCGPRPTR